MSKPIQIFASTSCVSRDIGFQELLARYQRSGIQNVEVSYFPGVNERTAESVLKRFAGQVMIHNFFPSGDSDLVLNLASPNDEIAERSREFIKGSIALTARLRCPWYSFHAGFVADPIRFEKGGFIFPSVTTNETKRAFERFLYQVTRLSEFAREHSVTLLIENNVSIKSNKGKLLGVRPSDFEKFFDSLHGISNLGMLLDVGHANVSAHTEGFSLSDMQRLKSRIVGIHLHENDGTVDAHLPTPLNGVFTSFAREMEPLFITMEARYESIEALSADYSCLNELANKQHIVHTAQR